MVNNEKEHRKKKPAKQAFQETRSEPNKIGASTPYQFSGKNLTAYGGLLPVATMLEKLEFQALVEETIICSRETRVMSVYKFVLDFGSQVKSKKQLSPAETVSHSRGLI